MAELLNEDETKARLITPALHESGWTEEYIRRERHFTDGRIVVSGDRTQRLDHKLYDYMLCYAASHPIAVVEAKDEAHAPGDGMEQAKTYAQMLDVPFAYSSNGHGVEEFDFTTNRQESLGTFPSPDDLWARWSTQLTTGVQPTIHDEKAEYLVSPSPDNPLLYPYYHEPGGRTPRYYQEIAVEKLVEAVLKGQKRILLAMATGTGKTFVAFQTVWMRTSRLSVTSTQLTGRGTPILARRASYKTRH